MITERLIQRSIYLAGRSRFQVLMPNYTPRHWFECDVFGVTRAGYFHEWEVKLSLRDFRADMEKRRQDRWKWEDGVKVELPGRSKHDLLAERSDQGPTLFWYVVPSGLVDLASVPEWAGLQYATQLTRGFVRLQVVRQAPRLHGTPINQGIVQHALSVCYFRYWDERARADQAVGQAVSTVVTEVLR